MVNTDLIIVGGGAAGLMAGLTAGELGVRALVLERKHRPGLKLLMCGNNRCNVTHAFGSDEMLAAYADPVRAFLTPAIRAFPPADLRDLFGRHGLKTIVHPDGRVFPASGNADDVLHLFTDRLRDGGVPLVLNAAVNDVLAEDGGFLVRGDRFEFRSRFVLLCTGGVSYPKTGSVGDGQRFARALGHKVVPYRPGLAGLELERADLAPDRDVSVPGTRVTIREAGRPVAETVGEILFTRRGARGPAMVNAASIIGRENLRDVSLEIDFLPGAEPGAVAAALRGSRAPASLPALADPESRAFLLRLCASAGDPAGRARLLGAFPIPRVRVRPLKEAMVTVGGVSLEDADPETCESLRVPGLFFAGEVLDVDGPTGGYNLHAAFATARLALTRVAARCAGTVPAPPPAPAASGRPSPRDRGRRPPRRFRGGK